MSTTPTHRRPGWMVRAVAAVRRTPRPILGLALLGFVAIGVLVGLGLADREQAAVSTQDAASTQETLDRVADPLAALCAVDASVRARVGDACFTAQQVVERPPDPVTDADPPRDGRGIVATVIRPDDGHLVVSYTDGSRIDVGPVVGRAGTAGRGIAMATITAGRLVLAFTDGTTQDLGPIVGEVGAAGRGVAGVAIVEGRLVVTYDDATTQDAGPVPPGTDGAPGPDCPDGFEPVETSGATGADGIRYSRSITCVDPSSAEQPPEDG